MLTASMAASVTTSVTVWVAATLAAAQAAALALLLARLMPGRRRRAPVAAASAAPGSVSVVVATLNEAHRLGRCMDGLLEQGPEVAEILVVDSRSSDGTREIIADAARRDRRVRLVDDGPLPDGWVGKVWALECGLRQATAPWVLGVDADTTPAPGLVGGIVTAAEDASYDVLSLAPRFAGQGAGERWLQPALLTTLIYRVGAVGDNDPDPDPERAMANGQCFLARRALLERHGGYAPARASFSDDVTLARHLARRGARVGFMDGSRLLDVRAYSSALEAWREWGRSLDLKDSTTAARQAADVVFLLLVQGLPVPILAWLGWRAMAGAPPSAAFGALLVINASLVSVRVAMCVALRRSYERRGLPFWLSPLADPLAAVRILLSSLRRPRQWRGRVYAPPTTAGGA